MAARRDFYLQTAGNGPLDDEAHSVISSAAISRSTSPLDHPPRPVSPLLEEVNLQVSSSIYPPTPRGASLERPSSGDTQSLKIDEKPEKRGRGIWGRVNGWWWWEISAALLSIVAMVLLFILLVRSDNRPLESWTLPIQPNSLISVFTTVAKTSMMVPVASCISQLKWRHFMHHSDKLDALQVFDDASRGPWGSAMLLLSIRRRALIAWALAFVTIVALGIDPSAQQILAFPTRVSSLNNVTAVLGRADNYISKGYQEGQTTNSLNPNPNLLKLQAAILNGASGDVSQPTLDCPLPATSCEFGDMRTLGVCSEFKNVTALARPLTNCTGEIALEMNCTYDFPGRQLDRIEMTYSNQGTTNGPASDLFRSTSIRQANDSTGYHLPLEAVKVVRASDGEDAPTVEVYQATWFWCERTFDNVTATPTGLASNAGTFEQLSFVEITTAAAAGINSSDEFATYRANSGETYNITSKANQALWNYLGKFLSQYVYYSPLNRYEDGSLDIGSFLYTSDLENITANIATTLTNQIRSQSPGDNSEAVEADGTALFREVYIHVRWGWFILPLVETVLVGFLLLLVMVVTRRHPLLKESVVPYIVYARDKEVRDALEESQPVTGGEMSDAAKKVSVRLTALNEASLGFVLEGKHESRLQV